MKKYMNLQNIWAGIIGIIFLAIGVVGLVPETFPIAPIHDWIHIISGLILLGAVWKGLARQVNLWFGIIYGAIGVLGFFGLMDFIGVDLAINVYHLIIVGIPSIIISQWSKNKPKEVVQ